MTWCKLLYIYLVLLELFFGKILFWFNLSIALISNLNNSFLFIIDIFTITSNHNLSFDARYFLQINDTIWYWFKVIQTFSQFLLIFSHIILSLISIIRSMLVFFFCFQKDYFMWTRFKNKRSAFVHLYIFTFLQKSCYY